MEIRNQLADLVRYLKEAAERNRNLTENCVSDLCRGNNLGYAGAYELCAEWINEILEGTVK